MTANVHYWRATRYAKAGREHWGVFCNGELVDASFDERDVELRSCSLCEDRDNLVIVRHIEPRQTASGLFVGFHVEDMTVRPLGTYDGPGEPPQSW